MAKASFLIAALRFGRPIVAIHKQENDIFRGV
jgi:hypothetical protein